MPAIHKAKDSSFKLIFGNNSLFTEFLRDFINIEILKDIDPSAIEDITERFLPLFTDQKDSDTVKRINLKNNMPFFVISIIEHESEINHRASFKMLQYIALVLNDYEKEANSLHEKISFTKAFKYPPVLPVIFYDGQSRWTADMNFLYKTEMNDIFKRYIPKFEYILVNLNKYSVEDLAQFGDTLSLIMILDKIRKPDELRILSRIPPDYVEKLALNVPNHLKKLITDVITVLLTKINVPKNEIEAITEKIEKRRFQEMFAIENYDVQATRREAEKKGVKKGKIEDAIEMIKELEISVSKAMHITKLPASEQEQIIKELIKQNIPYEI